jgi:hypothetical protein
MEANELGLSEAMQFYFRSRSDVVLRRRFLTLYLALETMVSNAPTTQESWVTPKSQRKMVRKKVRKLLEEMELLGELPDGKTIDLLRLPARAQQRALISELGVVTQDLDPEDKLPWVNTRNDLVHQAKSKPTPELLNEIERLEIFVERLFLRVLGVPTDAGLDPDEPFESHAYAYREPTLFDWD